MYHLISLIFLFHLFVILASYFLRRIRYTLDLSTAKTVATSLVHSHIDYCNSLFLNLPSHQLNRLQLMLNSAARAITKTPKFNHISPILKSFTGLKLISVFTTKSDLLPTIFFNLNNLLIYTIF